MSFPRVPVLSLLTLPLALAPAAGCGGDDDPPIAEGGRLAIVAGDFSSTGVLATISTDDLAVADGPEGVVAGDPALRRLGDELFVINRFGSDNLTILAADDLALVAQVSTGPGSNPQDVAQVDGRLYVAALGAPGVLVIDRAAPDTIDTIDLSSLDDDGLPDCVSAHAVGSRVFVACGLLDENFTSQGGKVVVIDTATDELETTIDLPSINPTGWFELAPAGAPFAGDLLIPTALPGFADYSDGCLARVGTGASPAATCAVANEALGGFVGRMAFSAAGLSLAVNAYAAPFTDPSGWVVDVDAQGQPGEPLTPDTVLAQEVAACGELLFVVDKAPEADGVRAYRREGGALLEATAGALDIGLPPVFGNSMACLDP